MKFDRKELLNHPLVKKLIDYKYKRTTIPGYLTYLGFYFLFVIILTSYALALPRPTGEYYKYTLVCAFIENLFPSCCKRCKWNSNECIRYQHDRYYFQSSISKVNVFYFCVASLTAARFYFLYTSAVISILCCIYYLVLEIVQFSRRGKIYLQEAENYIQCPLYILGFIFAIPLDNHWILPSWRWQIGAISIFLAWFNFIILLRGFPSIGKNVTMLFSVYYNFLKLIYLPIFLILTFAFPFYMLLVYDGNAFVVSS